MTLKAKPWLVTQRAMRTPIAASFSQAGAASGAAASTQAPVKPGLARGRHAERSRHANHDLFEIANVAMHVEAIGPQIEDWIADELAGAVERHVAAAARFEELDALARERLRESRARASDRRATLRPSVMTGGCSRRRS